jgi:hypothetical protein
MQQNCPNSCRIRLALPANEREEPANMDTISKDLDDVVLICHDCPHVEHIGAFDESAGSRRTQAARAMQIHSRDEHGEGSVLRPVSKDDDAL